MAVSFAELRLGAYQPVKSASTSSDLHAALTTLQHAHGMGMGQARYFRVSSHQEPQLASLSPASLLGAGGGGSRAGESRVTVVRSAWAALPAEAWPAVGARRIAAQAALADALDGRVGGGGMPGLRLASIVRDAAAVDACRVGVPAAGLASHFARTGCTPPTLPFPPPAPVCPPRSLTRTRRYLRLLPSRRPTGTQEGRVHSMCAGRVARPLPRYSRITHARPVPCAV